MAPQGLEDQYGGVHAHLRVPARRHHRGADPHPGTAPDGLLAVGDIFQETIGATALTFGDGSFDAGPDNNGMYFICVAIDPQKNYVIGRAIDPASHRDRIVHSYKLPWTR